MKAVRLLTVACWGGLAALSAGFVCDRPEPSDQSDSRGEVVTIPDTEASWYEFVTVTDFRIKDERAQKAAPAGSTSWNAHWARVIHGLRQHYENHEKYVEYIVLERRRAGLPELTPEPPRLE